MCMPIYFDNRASISIAWNPTFYENTKHIETDYLFSCDKVLKRVIVIPQISSPNELANFFT